MRIFSRKWLVLLAAMLLVACGKNEKKKDDKKTNGDTLTLKFGTDLANFEHGTEPKAFKVSVYKGDAVDEESTLEITVKIVCGEAEASKAKAADEGVANFTPADFGGTERINFKTLTKGTKCTATATAAGATAGEKKFESADAAGGDTPALTVAKNGMITAEHAPAGAMVKLSKCTAADATLVKWTSSGVTFADKDHATGLAPGDLYLSGDDAGCEVMMGVVKANLDIYDPADDFGVGKAATSGADMLVFTHDDDKTFDWFLESTDTLQATQGSVDGAQANIPNTGITANHSNVEIWIKHTGGVEKLN